MIVFVFNRAAPPAALAGIALAAWAMLGVLTDLADRSGIAKLPPGSVWRRFCHCRAALGDIRSPISGLAC